MKQPLEEFRKQNQCFVSWTQNRVYTNEKRYDIEFIEVGNTKIPYVIIKEDSDFEYKFENGNKLELNLDTNIKDKIRTINNEDNKNELKGRLYTIKDTEYYVIGIGGKSIKAYKNNNIEPEYFWYHTKEGEMLLDKLSKCVEQKTLLI